MKNDKIYTCYGCPHFYADKSSKYSVKHCGQDHFECPYFWGDGSPLGLNKEYVGFYHSLQRLEVIE